VLLHRGIQRKVKQKNTRSIDVPATTKPAGEQLCKKLTQDCKVLPHLGATKSRQLLNNQRLTLCPVGSIMSVLAFGDGFYYGF